MPLASLHNPAREHKRRIYIQSGVSRLGYWPGSRKLVGATGGRVQMAPGTLSRMPRHRAERLLLTLIYLRRAVQCPRRCQRPARARPYLPTYPRRYMTFERSPGNRIDCGDLSTLALRTNAPFIMS